MMSSTTNHETSDLETLLVDNLPLKKIIEEKKIDIQQILSCKGKELGTLFSMIHYLYTKALSPSDLKRQYMENRFTIPSEISQREFNRLENLIYTIIPIEYQSIELSPVSPIGTNSVLTKINQKTVISTTRNTEVLADATTLMALEACRQREELYKKSEKEKLIKLCSAQRFLRAQLFSEQTKFLPHFKAFSLCTAGRNSGNISLEYEILSEHLRIYLDILDILKQSGYDFGKITVNISDIRIIEELIDKYSISRKELCGNTTNVDFNLFQKYKVAGNDLLESVINKDLSSYSANKYSVEGLKHIEQQVILPLKDSYPHVEFLFDLGRFAGMGYYDSYCIKIHIEDITGEKKPIIDAGFTNWTKQLMKNEKEIFFGGGFGLEFFIKNFRKLG